MKEQKEKWFGPCSKCGIEKKLATIGISDKRSYNLWLKRMCEDCRNKTLFYFYTGLGFKDTAEVFKKKVEVEA